MFYVKFQIGKEISSSCECCRNNKRMAQRPTRQMIMHFIFLYTFLFQILQTIHCFHLIEPECLTIWNSYNAKRFVGLIWIQIVSKGNQRTSKATTGRQSINHSMTQRTFMNKVHILPKIITRQG